MKISRADRSRVAEWWFTVDHALLSAVLAIVACGIVLSLAASPAVAIKKGLAPYYFVERHVLFSAAAVVLMAAVSLLSPHAVRRLALGVLGVAAAALVLVLITGTEINGARRWLSIAGHSVQPSEFAKPAFVVISAWLLAEARSRPDMPALTLAMGLLAALVGLLVAQPDIGQTLLVVIVWGAMLFASGQPLGRAGLAAVGGILLLAAAYHVFPHVAHRIDRFANPVGGDFSQLDQAMRSFAEGGFFGRGPGEGTIKSSLPDAHTDFIFAVVAEEYGAVACLAILALFAFVVVRALLHAVAEPDASTRLAIVGLAVIFGLQALINMGVNAGLLPAKGMTLPFISSGGSSMLAQALTLGMLLALTRHRPDIARLKKPRMVADVDRFGIMGSAQK